MASCTTTTSVRFLGRRDTQLCVDLFNGCILSVIRHCLSLIAVVRHEQLQVVPVGLAPEGRKAVAICLPPVKIEG